MCKSLAELEAEAGMCEAAGLDGVWWPDYQGPTDPAKPCPEIYVTLTALARATSRIFIGSLVTDVLKRHPMVTAHAFATLSHMAPGRVILGLGTGGGTSHFPFGISLDAPASRLREGIAVIRRLWAATQTKPADYEGKYFRLRKAALPLLPREPIPIYMAATGPRMLALAGSEADGWLPEAHTPETYRQALARVEAARRGRRGSAFEPCLALLFFPFESQGEERQQVLEAAKSLLSFYPDIVRRQLPAVVPEGVRSQDLAAHPAVWQRIQEAIPDELAARTALIGPVDAIIARLRACAEAGCRHVVLEPYWGMPAEQIREAIAAARTVRSALHAMA